MDKKSITLQDLQAIHSKLDNIYSATLSGKTVLTLDEVASYTGLSKSYLYKLTAAGLIPHSKPNGKNVYFDKQIIEKWLLRNEAKSNDRLEKEAVHYVALKSPKP
jgi:excisionase family DNA binding protein